MKLSLQKTTMSVLLSGLMFFGSSFLQAAQMQSSIQEFRKIQNICGDGVNYAVTKTAVLAGVVSYLGAAVYESTSILAREEYLVASKYPDAQKWYEALSKKYPDAHLEQKRFSQTMRGVRANAIAWCSAFDAIYFPQASLKEINRLYKKKMKNKELTQEELTILAKEEFILLHEAGHIEHNDMWKRLVSIIGIEAILSIGSQLYLKHINPSGVQRTIVSHMDGFIPFFVALFGYIRYQEAQADNFACQQGDIDALKGGITFFEDEDVDPLYGIENKKLSPFIETKSFIGGLMQRYANYGDGIGLALRKFIQRHSSTRWMYDYLHDFAHPGPSTRAQKIRNHIAEKEKSLVIA